MKGAGEKPEYDIRTRELSSAERAALQAGAPTPWAGAALIFVIWCVFPSWLFGWLARQVGLEGSVSHLVGGVLGLTLFLALWVPTRRSSRAEERDIEADVENGVVQVVAVRGGRSSIPLHPTPEPRLVVHLGEGAALALQGGWLNEGARFGCTDPEVDWDDRHFNGLPEPWAFPCPAFTLHRLPTSGRVLQVEVEGPYVKPTTAEDPSLFPYRTRDSTLLDSTSVS